MIVILLLAPSVASCTYATSRVGVYNTLPCKSSFLGECLVFACGSVHGRQAIAIVLGCSLSIAAMHQMLYTNVSVRRAPRLHPLLQLAPMCAGTALHARVHVPLLSDTHTPLSEYLHPLPFAILHSSKAPSKPASLSRVSAIRLEISQSSVSHRTAVNIGGPFPSRHHHEFRPVPVPAPAQPSKQGLAVPRCV